MLVMISQCLFWIEVVVVTSVACLWLHVCGFLFVVACLWLLV